MLDKERDDSGCNRTIKKIPRYTTNNNTKTERERESEGERERVGREKRERGKIGVVTADYSSSILQLRISKVKVKNMSSFIHMCSHMLISAYKL